MFNTANGGFQKMVAEVAFYVLVGLVFLVMIALITHVVNDDGWR